MLTRLACFPVQELSLLDYAFLHYAPSEVAAAAVLLSLGYQVHLRCVPALELALAILVLKSSLCLALPSPVLRMKRADVLAKLAEDKAEFALLVLQETAAAQRGWFMPASAAFAPLAARSGYRATELFEVGTRSVWCGCLRRPTAAPSRAERCMAPEPLCAQSTGCAVATVCITVSSYA
jgi:Cyclin, C-terminal domain